MLNMVSEWRAKERGSFPTPVECVIIFWVLALIWKEVKLVYELGIVEYVSDLWNLADCFTNMCFVGWIVLRLTAWFIVLREEATGIDPYYPRELWHAYDPYLISEGLFGAGMISSFLKLVHIFSVNPHLGPLQISLGRMAIDILKFLVLYVLVLFAFACGMNQLMWYYAELEYNKCYSLPGGLPDTKNHATSCIVWRRFANLFETVQSLFWASFGLVSLSEFELTGIKEFTRFWALLMFGSYSVCNIIVLLNMLIAMMSNSYQVISEKSDTEWKFARTKLWIGHFETGSTVPPPFNIVPTPKAFMRVFGCCGGRRRPIDKVVKAKGKVLADKRYRDVMKAIVRRYITAEQKKAEEFAITEDDVSEIRQDINKFRYEMINILRRNNFETPNVESTDRFVMGGKRAKQLERRVLKGFNISTVDGMLKEAFADEEAKNKDFFSVIARTIGNKDKDEDSLKAAIAASPTSKGKKSSRAAGFLRLNASFPMTASATAARKDSTLDLRQLDADELAQLNPRLETFTPQARLAYAKFRSLGGKKALGGRRRDNGGSSPAKTPPVEHSENCDAPIAAKKPNNAQVEVAVEVTATEEEDEDGDDDDDATASIPIDAEAGLIFRPIESTSPASPPATASLPNIRPKLRHSGSGNRKRRSGGGCGGGGRQAAVARSGWL